MLNNEVMFRVHRDLHSVANHPGTAPAGHHRTRTGIVAPGG